MINWFDMPAEGLSNGGQFEIKELTATENKVYQKDGEVYNKVTVNVDGGGGGDFSTARGTLHTSISNQAVVIGSAVILNENDPSNPLVPFIEHDWYDGDTYDFVLYNGTCTLGIMPSGYDITDISADGGAEVGDFGITITGDFTLNVTLSE